MSYATKYYCGRIGDISGNTFIVNLKKKDYHGGTIQITSNQGSTTPLTLNYRGGRDQVDSSIRGSEVNFNFYVLPTDNYDDLLESEYQDWQLEILKATGSTDFVSGATQLLNDTSTGQAWSVSGTTAYNTFTAIASNSFNGSFSLNPNGSSTHTINLGSYLGVSPALTTIPIGWSSSISCSPQAPTQLTGVTTFGFTINGNVSAPNISVNSNTAKLHDNTSSIDYNATIINNNTHTVTIQFTIPTVASHSFTFSGTITISGG